MGMLKLIWHKLLFWSKNQILTNILEGNVWLEGRISNQILGVKGLNSLDLNYSFSLKVVLNLLVN